jgi:surface polysaccharide O-acyltransferase-like enzyme
LISGYIFAGEIWEARRKNITKITVLWTALARAHWGLVAEEEFQLMFPGASEPSTAAEWVSYEMLYNSSFMFLVVVIALVLSFIGLYVGSMLRKPRKS